MNIHGEVDACTRNGIERVNLTTGEVTDIWSEATPGKEATRYHDVDRLNETHFVVADIFLDRVFIVNTRDGQVEWTWNASDVFRPTRPAARTRTTGRTSTTSKSSTTENRRQRPQQRSSVVPEAGARLGEELDAR